MVEFQAKEAATRRRQTLNPPARRKRKGKAPKLMNWGTLPDFLKDNEFITSGYRANWSFMDSLKSLFQLHNETGNVWSHLLGFLLFLHLTVHLATSPPSPQALDSIWHSVHSLNGQIEEGVHSLQSSLLLRVESLEVALHHSLVSLRRSLETSGAAVKSHLQEHFEVAKESIHDKVDVIKKNLHQSLESLSVGLSSFQESLEHPGGALVNVTGNLESSVRGLHDSLHHVQDVVAGNLVAMRETVLDKLSKSFATLQASLHHCQEVLGISNEDKEFGALSQCPVNQYTSIFQETQDSTVPRWPVYFFMMGAMSCMLISSTCHLFGCCSKHTSAMMWKLDYMGISFLIVSSFFPPVYYGFQCHPNLRRLYLAGISVLGLTTMVFCIVAQFQSKKLRTMRAKLFSALGCSGVIPMVHQVILHHDNYHVWRAVFYMILMGATYLAGAYIFAMRIPEKYYPGSFDLAFNSHQLFHVAVVTGALLHFRAVMILLNWRESTGGCPVTL